MLLAEATVGDASSAVAAWVHWWRYAALAVLLIVAAVTDVRSGKIPNLLTYPALAVGLIGHTLVGGLTGTEQALGLAGALAGAALGATLLVAWVAGAVGGGDAKLMLAVGALTGWRFTLRTMFWGFVVAALMAMVVMIRRGIVRQTLGRMWRFLVLSLTPNRPAAPVIADSPRIPFGLALCIGAGAAIIETLLMHNGVTKLILGL